MPNMALVLGRSIRAGTCAMLLLLAAAGAASAADGTEAIPAPDAPAQDPLAGEVIEPLLDRAPAPSDLGGATVSGAVQGATEAIAPIVRSAPQPPDPIATIEQIAGVDAGDALPPDIELPVVVPGIPPVAEPTSSSAVPVAGDRGVGGRDIRDLAPDGAGTADRSVSPSTSGISPSTAQPEAGRSSSASPPRGDPAEGDAWTASALLLAFTLGLVGGCRPAVVAALERRLFVRVGMPRGLALLPAVPPG